MINPIRPGFAWGQRYELVNLAPGENIDGATVHASVLDSAGETQLVGPVLQSSAAPASYAENRIYVQFGQADTITLQPKCGQAVQIALKVTRGDASFVYDAGLVSVTKSPVT
jgi:hypothetical protein